MIRTRLLKSLVAFFCTTLLLCSCSEDPTPSNEEELITQIKMRFTQGGSHVDYFWSDSDGAGSGVPEVDDIVLSENTEYLLSIYLGDGSSGSLVDITEDIQNEGGDHQFFFIPDASLSGALLFTYEDQDAEGNPVGLSTTVQTSGSGTGKLKIILRHKLKKNADGVADGEIANAGGDTDIEVEFNVTIE